MRRLVRETTWDPSKLVLPLFVDETIVEPEPIPSLAGIVRHTVKSALLEAKEAESAGVGGVLLFGIPSHKDPQGSGAWSESGGVQRVARLLRDETHLVVMTDVCLCEYTDHGHCGVLRNGEVDNDATLPLLSQIALSHARAGAHVVAPSAMMDGQVLSIRKALDEEGFTDVAILSYAVKYASSFYGPFREAARSSPSWGDRRSHQMDISNLREALVEARLDVEEGADLLLVKPGLPALDVLREVSASSPIPVGSFQVSGEYASLVAAFEKGWLSRRDSILETLTALFRGGATFVVTYFAKEASLLLGSP